MSIIMLKNVLTFKADAIFTAALAAVMLLLGYWVKGKSSALRKYCIPAPVVGGFLFMFITFIGHQTGAYGFKFDTYFQDPFMLAFFTTVGLGASITLLKKGGALLIIYWLVSGIVSICQNIIGIAFSKIFGIEAPYALLASAISMIGGHGAAAAYGKTFVSMGYPAGLEVGMAAATFGLISAVLVGGPVARMLIEKYHLEPDPTENFDTDVEKVNAASQEKLSSLDIIKNVTAILCCMAIGSMISGWIGKLIHMSFPTYVGAMFTAVILRNLNEKYHFYQFNFSLVDGIGDVMLNLYLAIALMTLRLWELSGLLGGVVLVVAAQVVFMVLACRFVIFKVLGGNYDAAVMCAGLCGHGLGATPSAIVNMTAVKDKYGMSRKAFMIVPIVGAFLVDVIYQPQTIAFIKFFVMPK
ncbi:MULTISPECIES: sodium/glutamate symporter [Acidaminococcus]|jgi:ESS family glutamate:Na+ symporter|uniref:sodium/glutamate symporter n=1 Tax=Acidaminococcus TaxID=904 RepID=UPI00242E926E|nr:sodium/glutamate symporter [Acidaminococcus fermentans]